MKRWIAGFCILCMLLCLCACQKEPVTTEQPTTEPSVIESDSTEPSAEESVSTESASTEPSETEPAERYRVVSNRVQVYQVSSGTVWALATITVENTGTEALWMDYATVTLKTVGGKEVAVMDSVSAYPQILEPGETGYYCDTIALDLAELESLIAFMEADIQPANRESLRYQLSNVTVSDTSFGGMLMEGTVENTTETDGELVCICAILLDEATNPIGFISGYLDGTLAAGESVDFSYESFMLPEKMESKYVASYTLFAFPLEERS